MLSPLLTPLSKSSPNKPSSNSGRFFHMRPVLNAVKKPFRKVKADPLFRLRGSRNIPKAEVGCFHMGDELGERVSNVVLDSTFSTSFLDIEFVERRYMSITSLNPSLISQEISSETNEQTEAGDVVHKPSSALAEVSQENTESNVVMQNSPPTDLPSEEEGIAGTRSPETQTQVANDPVLLNTREDLAIEETQEGTMSRFELEEHAFGRDFDITCDSKPHT